MTCTHLLAAFILSCVIAIPIGLLVSYAITKGENGGGKK